MGRPYLFLLAIFSACRHASGALFLLSLPALLLGTAMTAKNQIRVELTLHAGEEDPYWIITQPGQIKLIQDRLQQLPPAPMPNWPTLGWRGFLLRDENGGVLPGLVRVFQGTICVLNGNKERCYHDQHKLEKWLESEARRQGLGKFIR